MSKILLVEDEPSMLKVLSDDLKLEGYDVLSASDGAAGLQLALNEKPDLIVLDVMLPKMSGFDVCRQIRAKKIITPIIMLTAKGQESDKVLGLELGADDYMTKPFSILELIARIKRMLKREKQHKFGGQYPYHKILTIMLTDIKDFTKISGQLSREEKGEFIKNHKELITPVIEKHHGDILNTVGDQFLVAFESPTNAVLTGIKLCGILKDYNTKITDSRKQLEIRIAITVGEVTIEENAVYGEAINMAARIEEIIESNEVYFTESVYLSMNRAEIKSAEAGEYSFKGIADKVKIYKAVR